MQEISLKKLNERFDGIFDLIDKYSKTYNVHKTDNDFIISNLNIGMFFGTKNPSYIILQIIINNNIQFLIKNYGTHYVSNQNTVSDIKNVFKKFGALTKDEIIIKDIIE